MNSVLTETSFGGSIWTSDRNVVLGPCFQTPHTSVLLGGTLSPPGEQDPTPLVFLAAGPTPCHPIVLRRPSARSPADGPSAPARLISSTTRGLCFFLSVDPPCQGSLARKKTDTRTFTPNPTCRVLPFFVSF